MDFTLTEDQTSLLDALEKTLEPFDDNYWMTCDRTGNFPDEFVAAMAQGGWLGVSLPEDVGGSGLGVTEAALMMGLVASKGGMTAASSIHMNIFGPKSLYTFGTGEQRQRWLPDIISGRTRMCFAVTEPDTGLDTTRLKTRAVRRGERYVVYSRLFSLLSGLTQSGGVPVYNDCGEQVETCHSIMLAFGCPVMDFALSVNAQCIFKAWWNSPLFRPFWVRRCMSASRIQSIMNRLRSTQPISRRAAARSFWRG